MSDSRPNPSTKHGGSKASPTANPGAEGPTTSHSRRGNISTAAPADAYHLRPITGSQGPVPIRNNWATAAGMNRGSHHHGRRDRKPREFAGACRRCVRLRSHRGAHRVALAMLLATAGGGALLSQYLRLEGDRVAELGGEDQRHRQLGGDAAALDTRRAVRDSDLHLQGLGRAGRQGEGGGRSDGADQDRQQPDERPARSTLTSRTSTTGARPSIGRPPSSS